jgi:hypothetical protein
MKSNALPLLAVACLALGAAGCQNTDPKEKRELRWDFSSESTRSYQFEQLSDNTTYLAMLDQTMGPMFDTTRYSVQAVGVLRVVSSGDGKADYRLEELQVNGEQLSPSGEVQDQFSESVETILLPGVGEDGKSEEADPFSRQLFEYLFTLPAEPMAVGDRESRELLVPMNTMGMIVNVGGRSELHFSQITQYEGQSCAQLDTELVLDQFEVPGEEDMGQYEVSRTGRATFFFDLKNREFVGGTVDLNSILVVDLGMEQGIMRNESTDRFELKLVP